MPSYLSDPFVRNALPLLLAGCCALYAGSRLLVTRVRGPEEAQVGARAVAFFVPIAFVSLIAMLMGRPEIAVGVVFGTSVGAVTTVVGFVAVGGPVSVPPPRFRRVWPFLLVTALLAFVAGFGGTFQWREAVALFTQGLLLLTLWHDRATTPADAPALLTTHDVLEEAVGRPVLLSYESPTANPRRPADWGILFAELALLAALFWFGAWMVTTGAVHVGPSLRNLSTSAAAASIVSLAMVLPMTHGAWRRSDAGHGWAAVTTQIGVVFLNLCLLLPLLILIPYVAAVFPPLSQWGAAGLLEAEGVAKLLLFPAPVWRIDNVILIIAGALLLPVGLGKWTLGREEGMVLIAAYFFYLMATVAGGTSGGGGWR